MRIQGQRTKDGTMVTGGARPRRGRWRRAKSKRKLQRATKNSGEKTLERDESLQDDQADRLLLSALKYWEVERDLIEERLDTMRSATAAS
jgi:hypothetical protein